MDLDQSRRRIGHGIDRLLRWEFSWSPFASFLTGALLSLYLAALYLGVWSTKEASFVNSVQLAGSYLQMLSAATLARGLGRLENELFGRPPWWKRSTKQLTNALSAAGKMIGEAWRSFFGIPEHVVLSPDDVKLSLESDVDVSVDETVEYSSLEDRVDALEKRFQKRMERLESQQDRIETKVGEVESKAEDVKEDLRDEIETVWSFDLQMEVVALLWLVLGPLMSSHPAFTAALLSLSWL